MFDIQMRDSHVNLRVTDSEKKHLKKLAYIEGLSLSSFVKKAINFYIESRYPNEN